MLHSPSVTSFDEGKSATLAVSRGRDEDAKERGAEIIDLVYLPTGARPHPRIELDYDEVNEARELNCGSYSECLAFAASVQWRSFHCRRCPRYGLPHDARVLVVGARPEEEAHSGELAAVIRLRR